jgi:Rrf2 family iron-sulfur cluster assembly transcriptional regulator
MMQNIAQQTDNGSAVSLSDVAKETKMSRRYLEQLAIGLKKASLIKGTAGKRGGYILSRSAENIYMNEIVESAIGPINIVKCVNEPDECMFSDLCECRSVYDLINRKVTGVLSNISLADLADNKRLKAVTAKLESEITN